VTPLLRTSGDPGAFVATWQPLANLLEAMQRPRKPMTPLTVWVHSPIWPAAQQALPRARPSTVADVHNHA